MQISLLFKENGPENSVILYSGLLQLASRTNPAIWLHRKKKKKGKWTEVQWRLQLQHFWRLFYQCTSTPRSGPHQVPLSWSWWMAHRVAGSANGLPREHHFISSACSYLPWKIKCVSKMVLIRQMKAFRRFLVVVVQFDLWQISGEFIFHLVSVFTTGPGEGEISSLVSFNGMHSIF